jgi:RNA polymerase sigma-70 factor (ECF subfamily)
MVAFLRAAGKIERTHGHAGSSPRGDVQSLSMGTIQAELERVAHEDGGRLLAALIARFGNFELAEDSLQDAYAAALQAWSRRGIPSNPGGWLMVTARNRAIDRLRRAGVLQDKLAQLADNRRPGPVDRDPPLPDEIPDERLKLIFTCCHPGLPLESQVALTLRSLGGLSTDEIAGAFLLPRATLAQRLVRAKRKISQAGIPFSVPDAGQLPERLEAVMAIIYLIFNEGYGARSGEALVRADLSQEAIRLGEVLVGLLESEGLHLHLPEALGLLALMQLHDSRRRARVDTKGDLVLLEDQDRSTWDSALIQAGLANLDQALGMDSIGPYQIQAAISAVHARAPNFGETDWAEIIALYAALDAVAPSPIVRLNRAVAIGMAHGAEAGLTALQALAEDPKLESYAPFYAAQADFLRRAGNTRQALVAYERALDLTENEVEARFFRRRLGELSSDEPAPSPEKGEPSS